MSQGKPTLWVKKTKLDLLFNVFTVWFAIKKLIKLQQLFSWKNANANPLAPLMTKFNHAIMAKKKFSTFTVNNELHATFCLGKPLKKTHLCQKLIPRGSNSVLYLSIQV
jgi:hypothetical protein